MRKPLTVTATPHTDAVWRVAVSPNGGSAWRVFEVETTSPRYALVAVVSNIIATPTDRQIQVLRALRQEVREVHTCECCGQEKPHARG